MVDYFSAYVQPFASNGLASPSDTVISPRSSGRTRLPVLVQTSVRSWPGGALRRTADFSARPGAPFAWGPPLCGAHQNFGPQSFQAISRDHPDCAGNIIAAFHVSQGEFPFAPNVNRKLIE
jgi:hypothetical protein